MPGHIVVAMEVTGLSEERQATPAVTNDLDSASTPFGGAYQHRFGDRNDGLKWCASVGWLRDETVG